MTIATTRDGSVTSISTRASRPSELDRADDAAEAVPRREVLVAVRAAQALDLGDGHHPAVRAVALDAELAGAIPPPQRVESDPERAGRLARP